MANQTPDIRILVGNKGDNTLAQGSSGLLIKKNLEAALSAGIKIKVGIDKAELNQLKKQINSLSDERIVLGQASKAGTGKLSTDQNVSTQVRLNKAMADASLKLAQFNSYLQTVNPKGIAEFQVQIAAIRDGFSSRDPLRIKSAVAGMNEFKAAMKTAGYEGGNTFTYLESKIKTFATYLASSALTMGVVTGVRNIISTVEELDTSLTDLRIVTGGTRGDTQRLLSTYNQMAQELGSTTAKVSNSAVEWQRQGYNIADSNTLIKDSMVLSIVGFMDETDAATSLTAAMKGYKLSVDEAMSVVDKFTATDMVAASSAGTLAEALAKTAANAKLAGLSLDDVIAQLAVVNETMQESGEQTGTFYNTMLSRMGALKAGRLSDPETSDDLSDVEATLGGLGIKLRDSESEFRNFGEVLDEVGGKWESFSSVQQRAVATAFAGTRQQTRFLSLMSGWSKAQEYSQVAANSAGTALEKFGVYEESIEAKTNRMTAAFENFSTTLLDSGFIGFFIDAGTVLLNASAAFDAWPAKLLLLTTGVLGTVAAFNAFKSSPWGTAIKDTLYNLNAIGTVTTLAATNVKSLGTAFSSMTSAQIINTAVSKGMSKEQLIIALSYSTLDESVKKEILSQYGSAKAKGTNTAAGGAQAASNGVLTLSWGAVTTAIWNNIKVLAAWLVTNPIGWIILATGAIAGFAALIDACTISLEEQREKTEKLRQEYSDIASELDQYNSELETTQTRIDELLGKGPLSFTEQEELERLKQQNKYLSTQIDLQRQLQEEKAKEVNSSVQREFEMDYGNNVAYHSLYQTQDIRMSKNQKDIKTIASYVNAQEYYAELQQKIKELTLSGDYDSDELEKYRSELLELSNGFAKYASSLTVVDDDSRSLYNSWMDLAVAGQNVLNGLFWSADAEKQFDELWSSLEFKDAILGLKHLATEGRVTAKTFSDPAYKEFITRCEELGLVGGNTGVTLESFASHINSLGKTAIEASDSFSLLKDALSDIQASRDILDSALSDVKNSGNLSLSTIQKIIDKYPELEDAVFAYSAGLMTAADVLDIIQGKYDEDLNNYGKLVAAKNQLNGSFYTEMLKANQAWVSSFADKYGVDLNNYKNLAEAKLAIEKELLGTVTGAWKQFYNAQTNSLSEAAYHAGLAASTNWNEETQKMEFTGPVTPEQKQTMEMLRAIETWSKAIAEIDKVTANFSVSNLDFSKVSKDSKKAVEAYAASIDELREALKRLADVQDEIATKEAKLDLIDEDDIEAQERMTNELIALYKQEQAELHNLNNSRDGLIQGISEQLRDAGFDVTYDPDKNDFWVNNIEHLNELGANLDTKERNELIKSFETLIKKAEDYNEENIEGSLEWLKIQNTILGLETKLKDAKLDALKAQKDSLDGILDLTKEMIRQEGEDMIDALDDQADAYSNLISLQKERLQLMERERDYQDEVSDLTGEISKLQARADALSLDDSRSAQLERGSLLEQIADKQKELDDLQHDHALENQEDALDKEDKMFSDSIDARTKEIRKFLDNNQKLTQAAMDRINAQGDALYDDLLSYALHYTDTTESELQHMWQSAMDAAREYGDFVSALNSVNGQIDVGENGSNASPSSIKAVVAQMKANSAAWHNASPEEQKLLEEKTWALGTSIEATRDKNGVWWLNGEKLYDKYHSGGIVGGQAFATPKQNEIMALLEHKEIVLSERHQDNFLSLLKNSIPQVNLPSLLRPLATLFSGHSQPWKAIQPNINYTIYATDGADVVSQIKDHSREIANIIAKQFS